MTNKNTLIVEGYKKTHNELLSFLKKDTFGGDEIRNWIAKTIVYFTEIGVPENITSHFLVSLDFKEGTANTNSVSHGPFVYSLLGYKLKKYKLTSVLVAFEVATKLVQKIEEEGHIIPKALISELEKYSETKSLSISLKAAQTAFEKRDMKTFLTTIITSTDIIMNLIKETYTEKNKNSLRTKLQKAYDTESIQTKYTLNREILWALNNARIIRNIDMHRPTEQNEITLFELVSYAHLLSLFVSSVFTSGAIKMTLAVE